MGSCTSVPASPSGSNTIQQMSDTFRVRQLDARYRKKSVMNLRISDTDLIIEAKGKRGQPELIASVSYFFLICQNFGFKHSLYKARDIFDKISPKSASLNQIMIIFFS